VKENSKKFIENIVRITLHVVDEVGGECFDSLDYLGEYVSQ
jgi:hypothetical protein